MGGAEALRAGATHQIQATLEADDILFSTLIRALSSIGPGVAHAALEALGDMPEGDEAGLLEVLASCGARSDAIYERLVEFFQEETLLGAIYLGMYGDARALPLLHEAFDSYTPGEEPELLPGELLIELADAIARVGGELSSAQERKLEAARQRVKSASAQAQSGPLRRAERPDRNAPCWCGSGKKYKKCHWAEDERGA